MAEGAVVPKMNADLPPLNESLAERRLQLPGGVFDAGGVCHQIMHLRELTGADEELLCARQVDNGARQVSRFLARVIERIEGLDAPIDESLTGNMLIGDRDYLLLRLRQIEVGDHVHQIMRCPLPACGKKVDVDFLVSEINVARASKLAASYRVALGDAGESALVRLPTGNDQEVIAALALSNPAAANTRLFSRLILQWGDAGALDEEQVRALPFKLRQQLVAFLERTAPGPDLYLDVQCPMCGAAMPYTFDLNAFFLPSER